MDRICRVVAALLVGAGLCAAASAQEGQQDWCQAAIFADAAGDPEAAVEAYTLCLEQGGLDPELQGIVLHQRGLARDALGDQAGAIEDFTAALPLVPEPARTFSARAWARATLGEFDKAIYDMTQAVNADPSLPESWYLRGILRVETGDYEAALGDYDEAVRLAPADIGYIVSRAELRVELGDMAGAIADYDEVIALDPRFAPAWNARAWHRYVANVDLDKALEDIEVGLALEPANTDFVDTKAHLMSSFGRKEESLALFVEAAELGGPDRIRWYEEELAEKGFFDGTPDGELDEATREAFAACIDVDCRLLAGME